MLALSFHLAEDLVNVLLESELEHLISLIKHNSLDLTEIDVAPLNVVENAPSCSHEEINAAAQFTRLVFDADAAINGKRREFILHILQLLKLS